MARQLQPSQQFLHGVQENINNEAHVVDVNHYIKIKSSSGGQTIFIARKANAVKQI